MEAQWNWSWDHWSQSGIGVTEAKVELGSMELEWNWSHSGTRVNGGTVELGSMEAQWNWSWDHWSQSGTGVNGTRVELELDSLELG
ncbi:unnamed protein product [Lampetra planeri]